MWRSNGYHQNRMDVMTDVEAGYSLNFSYTNHRVSAVEETADVTVSGKDVFWGAKVGIEDFEFSKLHCCLWKFYYDNNKTLVLLIPVAVSLEEANAVKCPNRDQKVRVTYYRFSKILCCWETV